MEPRIQVVPAVPLAPELTIVVPTYNERDNVPVLIERIASVLDGVAWEVMVVDDDSPDGTASVVKAIAAQNPRVRCIRRVGRRGLSGACIEGMLASAAPVVAVMDADLQHDEALLPRMVEEIRKGADLVVGSRYVGGGSTGEGFSSIRQWGSETATALAKKMLGVDLTDPMSGFFMIRREKVEAVAGELSREGFKILLDIVSAVEEPLATVELPFTFRGRNAGESKLDSLVTAEYLGLLFSKLSGGVLPVRFLMFATVGASGVVAHLLALYFALDVLGYSFEWSQFFAVMAAMTWNFVLNNQLTYRDRRLTGLAFFSGLITFYLVCSFGTIANVGVASWIHGFHPVPWIAGLTGAVMGAVFNYAASSVLTWRSK
ncbi:glycosyltransferase family 2 protein [Prosthecomicrobium sp. N25]|uniref:glycosyltransferase family 2 protein n=1 Tax=Prosthecomicrobium sp. N25 TaxID=3129254 RepID=UPI0030785E5A